MQQQAHSNPYSLESLVKFINESFVIILAVGMFFLGGFVIGSLWTENKIYKKGGTTTAATQPPAQPTPPQAAAPTGPTEEQLKKMPEVTKADHVRGNRGAQVVLVEYSDLECPFCKRFHPTMQQISEEYGNKVAWVYRHYPLPFHANAQKAAEASECVAKVGGEDAFWKYIDLYTERTNASGTGIAIEAMPKLAAEIGVNESKVKQCLDGGEMTEKVTQQMNAASTAGISGTPGTIVVTKDGKYELISGAVPVEQVKQTIDKYL